MSAFEPPDHREGEPSERERGIERRTLALIAAGVDWLSAMAQARHEADDADQGAVPSAGLGGRRRAPRAAGRGTITARLGGSEGTAAATRTMPGVPGVATATAVVHRSAATIEAPTASDDELPVLAGGDRLPSRLRAELEAALGYDLDEVRVHTGPTADRAARALGARAFAVGRDVAFSSGAYDPASPEGVHLIAHEVAHTTQEPTPVVDAGHVEVSRPDDPKERAAEAFADRFASTRAASPFAGGVGDHAGARTPGLPPAARSGATTIHRSAGGVGGAGPQLTMRPGAAKTALDVVIDGHVIARVDTAGASGTAASVDVTGRWDPRTRTYALIVTYSAAVKVTITRDGLPALRKRWPGVKVTLGAREMPKAPVIRGAEEGSPLASPPVAAPAPAADRRSLTEKLASWDRAGRLAAPGRPPAVEAFPPIEVTPEEARRLGIAAAGVAAPLARPGLEKVVERPILRLIEGGKNLAPEVGPGAGAVRWLAPIAVGLTILLWPTETAPPWMDEIDPITGGPYASPKEYEWVRRLTPAQRDYLRRLDGEGEPTPAPDLAPGPGDEPVSQLDPARKDRKQPSPKVDFFHGTDEATALALAGGTTVLPSGKGEFGKGFYTFRQQPPAEVAARDYTRNRNAGLTQWGVVKFGIPVVDLAALGMAELAKQLAGIPGVLYFPDERTAVEVVYPAELGGHSVQMSWKDFVDENRELARQRRAHVSWPYDLIVGPLKGRLAGIDRTGLDQYLFNNAGMIVLNGPDVARQMVASGPV